jgi:hypothetical protein
MKVQVIARFSMEITRSEYAMEDQSTDDDVRETLRKQIDDGDLSLDDVLEQSSDYTITVTEAPAV